MQVKISARHGHFTPEQQISIQEQGEKLLHYFERISMIEIVVDLRGEMKNAEVKVDAEHKHDFISHADHADPNTAVHDAIVKMKAQIKHYKEKVQDHRRNPSHGGEQGIHP